MTSLCDQLWISKMKNKIYKSVPISIFPGFLAGFIKRIGYIDIVQAVEYSRWGLKHTKGMTVEL